MLSLLLLSACAPASPPTPSSPASAAPIAAATDAPTGTATAAPTPTTPDVAVPATVVVSATSIAVLDAASSVIVDIPFTTNGDDAADQLAAALGAAPVETVRAQGNCARPGTLYDFGGLVIDGPGSIIKAPPAAFSADVTSTATANGVALRGPAGLQIGASVAAALAAVPGSVTYDDGFGNTFVNLEILSDAGTPDETGAIGVFTGGSLVAINSPLFVLGDC